MKMLLVTIFALSCAQISNVSLIKTRWKLPLWPTSRQPTNRWPPTEFPTRPTTRWPTTRWPAPGWLTTRWPTTRWPPHEFPTRPTYGMQPTMWPAPGWETTEWLTTGWPTTETSELGPKVHGACSDPYIIKSGLYLIQPNRGVQPFEVYCDVRLDGRKWTVIQQRFDNSVDFYRNYAEYTKGFGSLTGNHWLGLEKIHQLTKNGDHELLVELQSRNSTSGYAQYSTFKVDSQATGFQLTISGYSGNAGDSMYNSEYTPNNGMKFTTFDKDQDMWPDINCAEVRRGAWWYNYGSRSELNGPYYDAPMDGFATMHWDRDFGLIALKSVRMMVRKK